MQNIKKTHCVDIREKNALQKDGHRQRVRQAHHKQMD